jgi:hypothetical protein
MTVSDPCWGHATARSELTGELPENLSSVFLTLMTRYFPFQLEKPGAGLTAIQSNMLQYALHRRINRAETMRPQVQIALLGAILAGRSLAAATDTRSQAVKDFNLGDEAGSCLVVKCKVFRGVIPAGVPKSGAPVAVSVQEWLFGDPGPTQTVLVPYDDREFAWQHAGTPTNQTATVLLALESGLGTTAGEPVLVTFDEREADLIRAVTDEALRLKGHPEFIAADVASLSSSSNPAVAGYMLHFVMLSRDITQRGLAAELLMKMLGNRGVPAERWDTIPFFLNLYSGSLSPEGRTSMVQRYADLARQEDENAARAGFMGLRFPAADPDGTLRSLIPPEALDGLAPRYRALVQKKTIDRSAPLEALLGIE